MPQMYGIDFSKEQKKWDEELFAASAQQNGMQKTLSYFATKKDYIPDTGMKMIVSGLQSGDNQNVMESARLYGWLRMTHPNLSEQFSSENIEMAEYILDAVSTGQTPEDALNMYRSIGSVSGPQMDYRRKSWREIGKKVNDELTTLIDDDPRTNTFTKLRAEIPEAMYADFSWQYQQSFLKTGRQEAAKNIAYRNVMGIWGASLRPGILGRGRLVMEKNPPEKMVEYGYDPDGMPAKWVMEQYVEDLESLGRTPETVSRQYVDSLGGYVLFDEDSDSLLLDEDGRFAIWNPDYASSSLKQEITSKKQATAQKIKDRFNITIKPFGQYNPKMWGN